MCLHPEDWTRFRALRNGAPFGAWALPGTLGRARARLAAHDDGDKQMVAILPPMDCRDNHHRQNRGVKIERRSGVTIQRRLTKLNAD